MCVAKGEKEGREGGRSLYGWKREGRDSIRYTHMYRVEKRWCVALKELLDYCVCVCM